MDATGRFIPMVEGDQGEGIKDLVEEFWTGIKSGKEPETSRPPIDPDLQIAIIQACGDAQEANGGLKLSRVDRREVARSMGVSWSVFVTHGG